MHICMRVKINLYGFSYRAHMESPQKTSYFRSLEPTEFGTPYV